MIRIFFILSSFLLIFSNSIQAQWMQLGSKLVGTGAIGRVFQGCSVSISADSSTAIVGGYKDNNQDGAAWVFIRSGDVWTQQGNKLVGTGAVNDILGQANQGCSVSLSADGNTAIVGGEYDGHHTGAAWVFTRSGGVWTQQGSKLVGTGAVGQWPEQGHSVSLSADGNTAIIGANMDGFGIGDGAVWVFTRSGGVWTQQGSKLVGTGADGQAEQGCSVSLSADGNTAIVGGPTDNWGVGAAWVFTRSGGVWTQQGSKLVGTEAIGEAGQGCSVSLSADGNTAIVGGQAVWVFVRSGGVWTQQGSKLVGTGAVGCPFYGLSVSLSADGNTAIAGDPYDNNYTGAVWVFIRSGGVWTQQCSKLVGTGAVGQAEQGSSVSISADGNTAIVGGEYDNNRVGAVWVFTKSNRLGLRVKVHLQNIGDRTYYENEFAGTRGQSRRLEGFQIDFNPAISGLGMSYMAHLQSIGDQPYVNAGQFIGTRGQSRRLEGFAIILTGPQASNYDVSYMAHLQGSGDTAEYKNGQFCGTRGESRRVEGIRVRVIHR